MAAELQSVADQILKKLQHLTFVRFDYRYVLITITAVASGSPN
jgi:hypothetical protein